MLPYTKAAPKELLPIVSTPTGQLVVEEAARVGCTDVLLVLSEGKQAVLDHFRPDPDLEKALEAVTPLLDHHYEGCRKSAISTLWRSYARVWQLTEEETGIKWEPGFPPKHTPSIALIKLGEIVTKGTLSMWAEESERYVTLAL